MGTWRFLGFAFGEERSFLERESESEAVYFIYFLVRERKGAMRVKERGVGASFKWEGMVLGARGEF